jgi:hypothetical protein
MFLLWGGRGRHWRWFLGARIALIVVFLIAVFAFHAHGTTLAVIQVVRVVLLVALIGTAAAARRRRRSAS